MEIEEESKQQEEKVSVNQRYIIGSRSLLANGKISVLLKLVDVETNEPLIGAIVTDLGTNKSQVSNPNGEVTFSIKTGKHNFKIQSLGYLPHFPDIIAFSSGEAIVKVEASSIQLEDVIVTGEAEFDLVEGNQAGVKRLELEKIEKLPTFLGEVDVINLVLNEPGVTNVGEVSSGFNVRGGATDQNLVLQDNGIIFNTAHALGFFGTFNSDLLQSVDLYKGYAPPRFGGRLASVLDVQLKDGDYEEYKGRLSISPVSLHGYVEGPINQSKTSFIAGGRTTYSNWVLNQSGKRGC